MASFHKYDTNISKKYFLHIYFGLDFSFTLWYNIVILHKGDVYMNTFTVYDNRNDEVVVSGISLFEAQDYIENPGRYSVVADSVSS